MLPIPTHLVDCTSPTHGRAGEFEYAGTVRCGCGHDQFQLHYPGQTHDWQGEQIPCTAEIDGQFFFIVKAKCFKCGDEHLLIDTDFHGWNGMLCTSEAKRAVQRPPLEPWPCRSCGEILFHANLTVLGESKESVLDEAEGDLDESEWFNAFGSFAIDIQCVACENAHDTWVSCETM